MKTVARVITEDLSQHNSYSSLRPSSLFVSSLAFNHPASPVYLQRRPAELPTAPCLIPSPLHSDLKRPDT